MAYLGHRQNMYMEDASSVYGKYKMYICALVDTINNNKVRLFV